MSREAVFVWGWQLRRRGEAGLARAAETLAESRTMGRLTQVCERWIYTSSLGLVLSSEEQEKAGYLFCQLSTSVRRVRILLMTADSG